MLSWYLNTTCNQQITILKNDANGRAVSKAVTTISNLSWHTKARQSCWECNWLSVTERLYNQMTQYWHIIILQRPGSLRDILHTFICQGVPVSVNNHYTVDTIWSSSLLIFRAKWTTTSDHCVNCQLWRGFCWLGSTSMQEPSNGHLSSNRIIGAVFIYRWTFHSQYILTPLRLICTTILRT